MVIPLIFVNILIRDNCIVYKQETYSGYQTETGSHRVCVCVCVCVRVRVCVCVCDLLNVVPCLTFQQILILYCY